HSCKCGKHSLADGKHHRRDKTYCERVAGSANPSMSVVEIYAANAEGRRDQKPDIRNADEPGKLRMHTRRLGPLPGLLKEMKRPQRGTGSGQNQPVANRGESGHDQQHSPDAKQESTAQQSLIEWLQTEEHRQPSSTEPPHRRNNERVGHQSKESSLENQG